MRLARVFLLATTISELVVGGLFAFGLPRLVAPWIRSGGRELVAALSFAAAFLVWSAVVALLTVWRRRVGVWSSGGLGYVAGFCAYFAEESVGRSLEQVSASAFGHGWLSMVPIILNPLMLLAAAIGGVAALVLRNLTNRFLAAPAR